MFLYSIYNLAIDRVIPLAIAIFGFGILILVHECGHFLFAKLFGVRTPTFSIGMGPALYQRQIGTTTFRIGTLPIGGYVEVEGQDSSTDLDKKNPTSFASKPYWQKLLIMIGGILFNALLAFIIFSGISWRGIPTISIKEAVITKIAPSSPAQEAGLIKNDLIIGVNDKLLTKYQQPLDRTNLAKLISGQPGDTITLNIKRNEKKLTKKIILSTNPTNPKLGFIGIVFGPKDYSIERAKPQPILTSIQNGLKMTINQGAMVAQALHSMIKRRSMDGVGGPIMIISQGLKNAREGSIYFLMFLAFISINLALLNLLPLGIVDGGRILIITLEAILRRNIPEIIHVAINLLSLLLLALLMLLLSYRDIIGLFKK